MAICITYNFRVRCHFGKKIGKRKSRGKTQNVPSDKCRQTGQKNSNVEVVSTGKRSVSQKCGQNGAFVPIFIAIYTKFIIFHSLSTNFFDFSSHSIAPGNFTLPKARGGGRNPSLPIMPIAEWKFDINSMN